MPSSRFTPIDTATGLQSESAAYVSITESCCMPRLYFYRGRGVAQYAFDKPAVELTTAPDLGFAFVEVDFEPLVCRQLRPSASEPVRDMTPTEIAACLAYLKALA